MTYWPPPPDSFPPMPEGSFATLPSATATLDEVRKWARENFVSKEMSERQASATVTHYVRYWRDWNRAQAELGQWKNDPFTSGVVVRHKASGISMVVVKKADYPRDRTCAWMADNRRRQDDFDLCELELDRSVETPSDVNPG